MLHPRHNLSARIRVSPRWRPSPEALCPREGVDTAKNAQVWSGSLDASFLEPEPNEDETREIVARVLEKYPDREPK